jgi:death-on-curing protein
MVSTEELQSIHELLPINMAESGDAISPTGIKDASLLHWAVTRQKTGFGFLLKYPTAEANAATLCYGVCCNHAFHNGNKRSALVALLCHLDKNDRTFDSSVTQEYLYSLMVKIAAMAIHINRSTYRIRRRSLPSKDRSTRCRRSSRARVNGGFRV